jgi:teichuronic acid biosynthesis glycosyltransferase TuaG
LLEQANKRQGAARNTGMKASRGDWIAFLDADDLWSPQKLERQLSFASNGDVLCTSGVIVNDETHEETSYPSVVGVHDGLSMYKMLYQRNHIPNLSVLMKSSLVGRVGFQDESLDVVGCEDWDYWIRLARAGATFYGSADLLFTYRVHRAGTSRNLLRMKLAEAYVKAQNLDRSILPDEQIEGVFQYLRALIERLVRDNHEAEAIRMIRLSRSVGGYRCPSARQILNR